MAAVHVSYSGRVQGVGFRYTCTEIARRFAIAGWVKNLPDGRVELLAEGEESEVTAFLDAVRDHFRGHLTGESRTPVPPNGTFPAFRIER